MGGTMARPLRLEFPGAIYHVINRGNYRGDIFRTEGAKAAFERCLWGACQKSGWVLHAYVLMRNHYHLALETPEGNLGVGMQWLQGTFANRFNKLRGERGHLFQGRYKSLLVERGEALGQVCHYIHLNPVRAGVLPVARLAEDRFSSYWQLWHPAARPLFLRVATALDHAGGYPDTRPGWKAYAQYLAWQAASGPAGKSAAYACLSKGWALGTKEFKTGLVADHAALATSGAWESVGKQEIRRLHWASQLTNCLHVLGKTTAAAKSERKSAPWKVATAAYLKEHTQANNGWLATQLHMGSPVAVSHYVGTLHRQPSHPGNAFLDRLTTRINN